jgi:hypothetical protein
MNGKLNENGLLLVERKGEYVTQLCPYTSFRHDGGSSAMGCGHWCPLFGEPRKAQIGTSIMVELCNERTLFFDDFTDEREA